MKQRDQKTGKFVRTTPDYKALYEAECNAHDREKEAFLAMRKERDEWKAKYEAEKNDKNFYFKCYSSESKEKDFLLDHCPFWVRWKYSKQFEKGK